MNLPVYKHPEALDDVFHYAEFIGRDNPDAAERFFVAARESFAFIGNNPLIGPARKFRDIRLLGLRSWRIDGFKNHLVFYRIKSERVEIIRVIHGAMDLEQELL